MRKRMKMQILMKSQRKNKRKMMDFQWKLRIQKLKPAKGLKQVMYHKSSKVLQRRWAILNQDSLKSLNLRDLFHESNWLMNSFKIITKQFRWLTVKNWFKILMFSKTILDRMGSLEGKESITWQEGQDFYH